MIATAISGCWEGTTSKTLVTVLAVEGQPTVSSVKTNTSLAADDHLARGAIIQTPASATVSLALLPNCLVRLEPNSSLEIRKVSLTKDGNETGSAIRERQVEVRLQNGGVIVSQNWGQTRARVSIITPQGEAVTPSNALFSVRVEAGATLVTCATGWVEFRPQGAENAVQISPSSVGKWGNGGSQIGPAETEPRGQEELQTALEAEDNLKLLLAKRRNIFP